MVNGRVVWIIFVPHDSIVEVYYNFYKLKKRAMLMQIMIALIKINNFLLLCMPNKKSFNSHYKTKTMAWLKIQSNIVDSVL